jgi:hypothetical protein
MLRLRCADTIEVRPADLFVDASYQVLPLGWVWDDAAIYQTGLGFFTYRGSVLQWKDVLRSHLANSSKWYKHPCNSDRGFQKPFHHHSLPLQHLKALLADITASGTLLLALNPFPNPLQPLIISDDGFVRLAVK